MEDHHRTAHELTHHPATGWAAPQPDAMTTPKDAMSQQQIGIIASLLADAGYTPLAKVSDPNYRHGFPANGTGFVLTPSPADPEAVRVTATAAFTGQDKYDHWGEAQDLSNRLADELQARGATFGPDITGREPNRVFDVYPPA